VKKVGERKREKTEWHVRTRGCMHASRRCFCVRRPGEDSMYRVSTGNVGYKMMRYLVLRDGTRKRFSLFLVQSIFGGRVMLLECSMVLDGHSCSLRWLLALCMTWYCWHVAVIMLPSATHIVPRVTRRRSVWLSPVMTWLVSSSLLA
jgi:hypothetical protein